jgi:hypothetical protein
MMRRLAVTVAVLLIVPFVQVGPAAAAGPLHSVVSNDPISGSGRTGGVDRTCPWSGGITKPSPEQRWTLQRVYGTATGREKLHLGLCVINSSGHGGAGYNGGDWSITRRDGTVSGTVTGGYETQHCCPGKSVQQITLVATGGTGSFENATGTIYLWDCNENGGLRLTPKQHWGC